MAPADINNGDIILKDKDVILKEKLKVETEQKSRDTYVDCNEVPTLKKRWRYSQRIQKKNAKTYKTMRRTN